MDHLDAVRKRKYLQNAPESGLKDAFQSLTGDKTTSMGDMATRIAVAMEKVSFPYSFNLPNFYVLCICTLELLRTIHPGC